MTCPPATCPYDADDIARAVARHHKRERQMFGWRAWVWVVGLLGMLALSSVAAAHLVNAVRAQVADAMPPRTWSVLELDDNRQAIEVWQASQRPIDAGGYVRFTTFDGQQLFLPRDCVAIVPPEWKPPR